MKECAVHRHAGDERVLHAFCFPPDHHPTRPPKPHGHRCDETDVVDDCCVARLLPASSAVDARAPAAPRPPPPAKAMDEDEDEDEDWLACVSVKPVPLVCVSAAKSSANGPVA